MKNRLNRSRAGFGLIEILVTLVIMYFLYYMMSNIYFKRNSLNANKDTGKFMTQQGIDTTNYQTIAGSAKQKIREIEEEQARRTKELETAR